MAKEKSNSIISTDGWCGDQGFRFAPLMATPPSGPTIMNSVFSIIQSQINRLDVFDELCILSFKFCVFLDFKQKNKYDYLFSICLRDSHVSHSE